MNLQQSLSSSTTDRAIGLTREILNPLLTMSGAQNATVRLWNGETLPAEEKGTPFVLVLNHPGALRRMLRPPVELSLGESFILKDFDVEGDLYAAMEWMGSLDRSSFSGGDLINLIGKLVRLPRDGGERVEGRSSARLSGTRHSRQRDRAAIAYHYDVGNDFYSLWLDRRMVYSCAYFPTGEEDIDTAQEDKLEYICRKLRLRPGEKLLDIGCGWGGLVIYAAEKYGVNAHGVTLSENQAALAADRIAAAGLEDRAEVSLRDYRDLSGETYDKIVSVGMFEHVGRSKLPEYFGCAYHLLKPGGLFLNHGISRKAGSSSKDWEALIARHVFGPGAFSQRYVFPDGELVPVSEACLFAEQAGFEVRDVENLREHYARTLRHWVSRLEAHRAEALAATDETTYRTWKLFMSGSALGFETGIINVNQALLAKQSGSHDSLPLTRAHLYS